MTLRIHHSNRMEVLAGVLAGILREDPGDPLVSERIVVPHRTIGRWLTLELARELGVAANLRLELPAGFAWSVMRTAVPSLPREQPFSPPQLRWRLHDLLPRFAQGDRAAGGAVRRYLADGDPRKRFELADRLARVLDRCVVYRPDWVREWERGDAPHWQARLWRRAVEEEGSPSHWVGAIDGFRTALENAPRPPDWPSRASFFAVSSLSPSYLDLLNGIGRGIEVNLFVVNPCREYWGDIYSPREMGRRADGADPSERHLAEGNELLAAWGRAGRDTFDSLVEIASDDAREHFVRPAASRRLAAVQRDVLDLRLAPEGRSQDEGRGGSGPDARDDSIQVHVCHSPVREAEVLHDRLLGLFDNHPDLGPADVLVLTPNLDVHGPCVEAVFGAAGRIPFNVARRRSAATPAVRAFFELLAMRRSRLGAEAVLAPLDAEAVRARFGIPESGLPAIRDWVREAGIRWGADAEHRAAEGLPATDDHGWRQGIRRLLLGYAVPGPNELVAGLVPCPPRVGGFETGADEAALLGRFVSYCDAVFGLRTRLGGERHPREWAPALGEEVDRFFAGGGPAAGGTSPSPGAASAASIADEVRVVRDLVRDFEREGGRSASRVGFDVVHDVLRELADAPSRDAIRLADGVTVTSLTPGQVYPAEVVCVIGLNDGTFPRSPSFPSFDLVAAGPARRGDRDVRHEDRFAFLEALLAARRTFLASYTGRGQRDDAPIPPAAVVDELTDYLGERFPNTSFVVNHPLQPFSPRYFAASGPGPGAPTAGSVPGAAAVAGAEPPAQAGQARGEAPAGLFSYSEGMCEAARSMASGRPDPESRDRLAVALPEPADAGGLPLRVALDELVAFFAHPARWLLRERLGARLEMDDAGLDDEEPFELDNLERYQLRSDILERIRAGVSRGRDEALERGGGRLPQAEPGAIVHERIWSEMDDLHRALEPHRATLAAEAVEIGLDLDGFHLDGSVDNVGPEGLVWWRPARFRARDRVGIWLRQLALAAAGCEPAGAVALWYEKDAVNVARFAAPHDAGERLLAWLRAWEHGRVSALPFFPETSLAYAKAIGAGADEAAALATARHAWSAERTLWSPGGELVRDPCLRLVHDGRDPLTEWFTELATDLLAPLVEAMR